MTKKLRLAWRFKVWPWQVPSAAIKYLSLEPLTERDIQRTRELAERFGWEKLAAAGSLGERRP